MPTPRVAQALVQQQPAAHMTPEAVFNLCSLYDATFDAAGAARRKRTLHAVATKYRATVSQQAFKLA